MALLWIEGFEGFDDGVTAEIQDELLFKYTYVSTTAYIYAGRTGGYSCKGYSNGVIVLTPPLTTSDTLIVGCAINPIDAYATTSFLSFYDGNTLAIKFDYSTTSGEISVYRGATLLGTTSGAGISVGNWTYVEVKVKCHDSTGTVEIRTGSIERLNLTAQDTQIGTHAYYDRVAINPSSHGYIDDLYVCDTTGSVNNDWVGIRKVIGIFPNADTATADWIPDTGVEHYSRVNEQDEGTGWLTGVLDDTDLWAYDDLTGLVSINGIQINTIGRNLTATQMTLVTPINSGGTVYEDAGVPFGTNSNLNQHRIVETDPNTGIAWTQSNLNSATVGIKVGA